MEYLCYKKIYRHENRKKLKGNNIPKKIAGFFFLLKKIILREDRVREG